MCIYIYVYIYIYTHIYIHVVEVVDHPAPQTHLLRSLSKRDGLSGGWSSTQNTYFTEMCSGSEAGSYLRLIDFVYHQSLGLRVLKKQESST